MKEKQTTIYVDASDAQLRIWGLFLYADHPAGKESALAFWADFSQNCVRFDDCTGIYRMEIQCNDGRKIYFCDNSGCARYYIHEKKAAFYTRLTETLPRRERIPNYEAIAQLLYFGCIYGPDTPLAGITVSDPGKYYVVELESVSAKDKNLTPLEELHVQKDELEKQMRRLARSAAGENIACTITGGTDSRAILAHMLYAGMKPVLDITGHDGQADVEIARKIAGITELELMAVSDEPDNGGWIEEAIQAADGMNGVCGIYRLYKKAKQLHENGVTLECGGAAGELYKNSFINQDLPFYGGAPRWERFVQYKVATYNFPQNVCGGKIAEIMRKLPAQMQARFGNYTGKNKANAYLYAGYEIMQARVRGVYSMSANWYTHYNPLLERKVAAMAFQINPYKLEMQAFQREQVSRCCPAIKAVETDRGLTCDSSRRLQEFVKSNLFLVRVALERIFRRGKTGQRIDPCFEQGLNSEQFRIAFARCKELGIVAEDISAEQIPQGIADRLFAIGTLL